MERIVIRRGNVLTVIRLGETRNDKIALGGTDIVQTYHFSKEQYQYALSGKTGYKGLMQAALTVENCFDCPFAAGKCYTHKHNQASGFLNMLRSIARQYTSWESIPAECRLADIVELCKGRYVRFGSYGEPVTMPYPLLDAMASVASSYSGYTHQWRKPLYRAYAKRLMASCDHTDHLEAINAGWRAFIVLPETGKVAVQCPASKEAGYKSHCAKCGLCSGTAGKGRVSIQINQH